MLIVSKHRDYYDSAVGLGIDKTIVYERHLKTIELPDDILLATTINYFEDFTSNYGSRIPKNKYASGYFIIGFCGKLYIGFKFTKENNTNVPNPLYNTKIIYDIEEARKFFDFKKNEHKKWYWSGESNEERLNNFILKIKSIDPIEWFRKFNTPIFVIGNNNNVVNHNYNSSSLKKVTINPILKDYDFAKKFDPYSAFQEIQMFISGVLGTNKDGVDIKMSEKQKVQQYGFDKKYGFRKRPK